MSVSFNRSGVVGGSSNPMVEMMFVGPPRTLFLPRASKPKIKYYIFFTCSLIILTYKREIEGSHVGMNTGISKVCSGFYTKFWLSSFWKVQTHVSIVCHPGLHILHLFYHRSVHETAQLRGLI